MSDERTAGTRSLSEVAATSESRQPVAVKFENLRSARARDYAVRFAFGAGVSLVAGLVSIRFGPRAGGLFLAFPAILPASLTLIEKKDGNREARADAAGGILGAVALAAFALVAWLLLPKASLVLALPLALAAWVVVAVVLFVATRGLPS